MMRFVCAAVVCLALSAQAQDAAKTAQRYTTLQAGEHVGETVTVCGVVLDTKYLSDSQRKPTFLNFDKPFPHHTFTAVIVNEARAGFAEAPEVAFKGKKVCVTGVIKISHSRPEMEVTNASQIEVDESAPAAPAAPATAPAADKKE